jgi:hypothetical protein
MDSRARLDTDNVKLWEVIKSHAGVLASDELGGLLHCVDVGGRSSKYET